MLTITIPSITLFDEANQEFIEKEEVVVELEHSLFSLSKWEAVWEKPFLGGEKTHEETISYIELMNTTPNIPPETFQRLSDENFAQINAHIDAKMSATWFSESKNQNAPKNREVITSELIYYWMVALNIPFECQHWHLARLFTLVKVCNQQNAPKKKMSARDLAARNRELNADRKAKLKTTG